jgi:hypothetical protein
MPSLLFLPISSSFSLICLTIQQNKKNSTNSCDYFYRKLLSLGQSKRGNPNAGYFLGSANANDLQGFALTALRQAGILLAKTAWQKVDRNVS